MNTNTAASTAHLDDIADYRDSTIAAIRKALRTRSGKAWSVRGGSGTSWGWITVSAPPARCNEWGNMGEADAAELGALMGFDGPAHHQGVSIPSSSAYRAEHIARAEGRTPERFGTPYWD